MLNTTSPVLTLRPKPELYYYDSRSVTLPTAITPLEAWNLMTAEPRPLMRLAFKTRDTISALFGVKRINGFSGTSRETVTVGDRLDFFLVEHNAPDMLVLTERDRHLDVMICLSIADRVLTITSSVVTHNAFGRIYMLPVGPAHKLIINSDLRRLKRKLEEMAAMNMNRVPPPFSCRIPDWNCRPHPHPAKNPSESTAATDAFVEEVDLAGSSFSNRSA